MDYTRLRKTTAKPQSGTSNLPKILPYPKLLDFNKTPSIHNVFCYIIKHYGIDGLSVLINRQSKADQVTVLFGDWNGNALNIQDEQSSYLVDIANNFIKNELTKFINIMRVIKIEQAQFFFSTIDDTLTLVDVQVSINKLLGPGMINDIFGKIILTQNVLKIEIIDQRSVEYINIGTGSYQGDLIIKPSKFRLYHEQDQNSYQPLYVEVKR